MRKATKTRMTMAAAALGVLALTVPAFAKGGTGGGGGGGATGGTTTGGGTSGGIKPATVHPGVCTGGEDTVSATARIVRNFWQFTNTVKGPGVTGVWHVTAWENDQVIYDTDSDFSDVTGGWSIQDSQVVPGAAGTKALTWRQLATNTTTGEVCDTTITVQSKI
jgi:hypothetical protein